MGCISVFTLSTILIGHLFQLFAGIPIRNWPNFNDYEIQSVNFNLDIAFYFF